MAHRPADRRVRGGLPQLSIRPRRPRGPLLAARGSRDADPARAARSAAGHPRRFGPARPRAGGRAGALMRSCRLKERAVVIGAPRAFVFEIAAAVGGTLPGGPPHQSELLDRQGTVQLVRCRVPAGWRTLELLEEVRLTPPKRIAYRVLLGVRATRLALDPRGGPADAGERHVERSLGGASGCCDSPVPTMIGIGRSSGLSSPRPDGIFGRSIGHDHPHH
jgi:hypothetical protein